MANQECLTTPDIVGNIMENATDSAGWYWLNRGNIKSTWKVGSRNINDLIDKYPMDVTKVTKAVNGGRNGLAERKRLFKEILKKMEK